MIVQVKQFIETFGPSSLYGQNEFTLQSLLLTVLPLCSSINTMGFAMLFPGNVDTLTGTKSKEELLLNHLLNATTQKLKFSFPNVIYDSNTDNIGIAFYGVFVAVGLCQPGY